MAYDAPHSIEQHRRLQNAEIEKHSSPPINFRQQPSHRSKCRSLSSLSILSSNNTSSSSSISSSNNIPQDHVFNQNIITDNDANPVAISTPDISFPSRIPFSWEKHPGIPKQQKLDSKKKLPLPPVAYVIPSNNQNYSSKRYSMSATSFSEEMMSSFRQDPFFMAMVECSKDKKQREIKRVTRGGGGGGGGGARRSISSMITSNLSDRMGMINMYGSCKSICAVSESSIIRLPQQQRIEKSNSLGRDGGGGRRL